MLVSWRYDMVVFFISCLLPPLLSTGSCNALARGCMSFTVSKFPKTVDFLLYFKDKDHIELISSLY